MRDAFSGMHPMVSFCWFALVIGFTMVLMHPLFLMISAAGAMSYAILLRGRAFGKTTLCFLLPAALLAMVINPLFNHRGTTILGYFQNGNPLTLESILYGFASALMLTAALSWFSCLSTVMTSDKWLWLLGRILPAIGMAFSLTLRFVPRLIEQMGKIHEAQNGLGRPEKKGWFARAKMGLARLSILTTWSLENAVDTADSMKSRGYGLKGRTSFSRYVWTARDKISLGMICSIGIAQMLFCGFGKMKFYYFPTVYGTTVQPTILLLYALLCFLPWLFKGEEAMRWKAIRSKI